MTSKKEAPESKTVLFVDDDLGFLHALEEASTRELSVRTLSDSAEVDSMLMSESLKALVVDHRLGAEDGISVLERAHSLDPKLSLILLTGYTPSARALKRLEEIDARVFSKAAIDDLLLYLTRALTERREHELDAKVKMLMDLNEGLGEDLADAVSEARTGWLYEDGRLIENNRLAEGVSRLTPEGIKLLRFWRKARMEGRAAAAAPKSSLGDLWRFLRRRYPDLFVVSTAIVDGAAVSAYQHAMAEAVTKNPRFPSVTEVANEQWKWETLEPQLSRGDSCSKLAILSQPWQERFQRGSQGEDLEDFARRWLKSRRRPFRMCYVHCSRGALLLRRPGWRDLGEGWLSYDGELRAYIGSDLATKRWGRVTQEILIAAANVDEVGELKRRVSAVYDAEIARIWDTYDPQRGDALSLICLVEAREGLVSSEDPV